MIDLVGLHDVARKRAGQFSLGMGQRLGIAAALLGDPKTVLLDEPVNGLDPEGIHWIRNLLKGLAAEGKTVFVSSHLMSEMALTADHLIVIGRGKLIADTSVDDFVARASAKVVLVRSPDLTRLREQLAGPGVSFTDGERGALEVHGLTAERGRRRRGRRGHRAPRADAAAGVARGGVHGSHPRRGRVRRTRTRRGDGRVSAVTPSLPKLETPGRVTFPRVLLSEWTKFRSVRSTKWSLGIAILLTIGIPMIAAFVDADTLAQATRASAQAALDIALVGVVHRAARDRGARRSHDHGGVLDRLDPLDDHRGAEAAARALGEADRLRPRHDRADGARSARSASS